MAVTKSYTQDEWLALFDEAGKNLSNDAIDKKPVPGVGTTAFAETIDHTLLKVEATGEQVDTLCEEARRCGFKVWHSCCVELDLVRRYCCIDFILNCSLLQCTRDLFEYSE